MIKLWWISSYKKSYMKREKGRVVIINNYERATRPSSRPVSPESSPFLFLRSFSRNMAVRCRRWTWWRTVRCRSWRVARGHRHPRDHRHPRRRRPRRSPRRRGAWGNGRAPCCAQKSPWLGFSVASSSPGPMGPVRPTMETEVLCLLYVVNLSSFSKPYLGIIHYHNERNHIKSI